MMVLTDESALSAWLETQGIARVDKTLEVGPRHVVLASTVEVRGIEYVLRPAPAADFEEDERPDPWALTFEHEGGDAAAVGSRLEQSLGDEQRLRCEPCSGEGKLQCPKCDGDGRVMVGELERELMLGMTHRSSRTCMRCNGDCYVECDTCVGSGALYGLPSAWSGIEEVSARRTVCEEDIPHDIYLEALELSGIVTHVQEGALIEGPKFSQSAKEGAYRDSAGASAEEQAAMEVLRTPELPKGARLLRQRLELRHAHVWHITGGDVDVDGEAWVLGDPPRIARDKGPEMIASNRGTVMAVMGALAVAVAALIYGLS
ncbi:MAG: hypothetical protein ACI9KE_003757 [Polyangiales bacterium]|jgi:hypothetical protein